MNDLHLLRILVTRPHPQGEVLCKLIEARGGQAIHFPTIDFAPAPDPQAFHQAIAELGEQDWLIFNSPRAVYASVVEIRRTWPQLPEEVKFAAVGFGTAKALQEAGYNVAVIPQTEWSSEGLLGDPVFQSVQGKKIAIIRGAGGREVLDNTLMARGAHVLPVIAYQRILPQIPGYEVNQLLSEHQIDVIVSASFESVVNLKIMLGEQSWSALKICPLVVVSERIKRLAYDLGFQTIWVASHASDAAILDTIPKERT